MNIIRMRFALLAVLGLSAALAPTARAEYRIETLDVPNSGGFTLAYGINNAGEIAGTGYDESTFLSFGFVYSGGSYTILNAPGAVNGTVAQRINDNGDVLLYAYNENWRPAGFLLKDGEYSPISPPGLTDVIPSDINNNGVVVGTGFSDDINDYNVYSFLLSDGTYTPFHAPGSSSTLASGINDHGDIVGVTISDSGRGQGFLYSDGEFTDIDSPGVGIANVLGINNSGSIVGSYRNADFTESGFVYRDGVYTTINIPGALFVYVWDINDREDIVGYYVDTNGNYNAFVGYAVVPEPSTMTLAALGFGGVGLAAVRRRVRRS